MPELPEVEALADHLRRNATGRVVTRIDVAALSVLKTFDPPTTALHGQTVTGANRWGKYLGLEAGPGTSSRTCPGRVGCAGRTSWRRRRSSRARDLLRCACIWGRGRLRSDRGRNPETVGGVGGRRSARRAADRLAGTRCAVAGFGRSGGCAGRAERADQDGDHRSEGDRRHRQRLQRRDLARGEVVAVRDCGQAHRCATRRAARRDDLGAHRRGDPFGGPAGRDAQGEKRSGLRVHARTGLPCPVCGDTVREVSFADKSFQYCPTCQTGGKVLADRRMSKLLK